MPGPSRRSVDTDAEAERVQLDLLRAASPAQRGGLAIALTTVDVLAALTPVARTFKWLG